MLTQKTIIHTRRELIWHKYLKRPYLLHVYDHGGTGPVMIFLHGLASSSSNWDYLIPLLKENYRCISIDLTGFGDSPKPQWYEYTVDDHIRNIHATIRHMNLTTPFTLLGHSLGGLLATRYARLHQHRIKHLVLLSPPVYMELSEIGSRSARQRTSLYIRAYRFIRTHRRVTAENFMRLSKILPQTKFLRLSYASWLPFVRSLEHCIETQTVVQDIKEVKAPIDIFYGLFDQVIVPYNIKQLTRIRDVTIHPLKVDHNVGKRYARQVANVLLKNVE